MVSTHGKHRNSNAEVEADITNCILGSINSISCIIQYKVKVSYLLALDRT